MVYKRVLLCVPILIDEPVYAVRNRARVMLYAEFLLPFSTGSLYEGLMFAEFTLDVC